MTMAALLALIPCLTALLTAQAELLKIVIASQPDDVRKALWERHMVITQPGFDLLSKLNSKIDQVKISDEIK